MTRIIHKSNHLYSLSCCAYTKSEKRKRRNQQAKQTHNFLVSIVVFVRESHLFCNVESWRVEILHIV